MTLRFQTGMELDYCGFSILDACLGITIWQAETPARHDAFGVIYGH